MARMDGRVAARLIYARLTVIESRHRRLRDWLFSGEPITRQQVEDERVGILKDLRKQASAIENEAVL